MTSEKTIPVWDLPTRLFHWALVACIALAWVTAEAEGAFFVLHIFFGESVVALVIFRLIWGVVGGRHARFADFVRPWSAVKAHFATLSSRLPSHASAHPLGHNPAAGWMVLALLAFSFLAAASGLFIAEDDFTGPFAHTIGAIDDDLHEGVANFLLILIVVHVCAALVMIVFFGENLIRAMWTGDKSRPETAASDLAGGVTVPLWRAVVAFVFAGFFALWPFL